MEDFSMVSISYWGNLERVFQDKRACTLITCYILSNRRQTIWWNRVMWIGFSFW